MATLVANTTVRDKGGFPVVLTAGSEVPEWAEGLVGDHLLTDNQKVTKHASGKSGDVEPAGESPDFTKPASKRRRNS